MAEIIWTKPALTDLNYIAEYIALHNPTAAKKLVKTAFNKVGRLQDFPDSGRIPPELPHLNYREIVVPPCRIFYKQQTNVVVILFVMRQEQDLRRFMLSL
ncbi:type II toxin-antitoxin system RelE/ParE family toxin [Testudinibacter sp. P27/CKL/0425]